jgi:hypothetical protein
VTKEFYKRGSSKCFGFIAATAQIIYIREPLEHCYKKYNFGYHLVKQDTNSGATLDHAWVYIGGLNALVK